MRSWHLFLTTLFMLLFGSMYAQTVGTQTFSATGIDSGNFQLVVVPSDITVNGGETIQSITISDFTVEYLATGNMDECGTWYGFDLAVTGGTSDGVSIPEGCIEDFQDMDITDFTNMSLTSQDIDDWSDNIYIELVLEVTYGGGGSGSDGCLDAPNGQYPAATFMPVCDGNTANITTLAWTGEYSKVQVTGGNEYTFSSSIATDFVTVGNEDGTVAYASGVTPITWTADSDQVVRFYLHLADDCSSINSGLRARAVSCTEGVPPADGCLDAPNGQYPAATFMPVCDGNTANITTLAWTGEYSKVQVTGGNEYTFSSSIATDFVTVGNEDGTVAYASGVTPITWTADSDQVVRFYLHLADDCSSINSGLRARAVSCTEGVPPADGCLDAPNGQYPTGAAYVPACVGTPEAITTAAWTGEYSLVQVTAGTEYTFSSSIETDFITIGNEDGTVALASGVTPITWTADADQVVRFYLHLADDCSSINSGLRSRIVQCGEPYIITEPDFPCFQGDGLASNGPENGYGVDPADIYRVADDFFVDAGTEFVLQQVSLNVLSSSAIDNATFNIHADEAGAPSATIVGTFSMAPTESNIFGTAFSFAAYNLKFDLASPITLPEGTYWLEPTISNTGGTTVYWEMSSTGSHGAIVELSNTSGTTWVPDDSGDNYQAVFFVAGECNPVASPEGCLDAENGQYPSATFTPACNGAPETITTLAWTGEYSLVQVTAGTEYTFSSSIDTDFVTIGNEDGTVVLAAGTTPVTWTADADQLIRFYLHFDSDCNWEASGLRSRIIQCGEPGPPQDGCLTASFGQYPTATFVPACIGSPQVITDLAYAGEYSVVQVTAGTEYIFSSSIGSDFITIGDEAGENVLAYGQGPLTWTADADQLVRFYVHVDDTCMESTDFRARMVQCGEVPPPPSACTDFVVLSNNLENGLFFEGDTAQHLAVDVPVADQGFTVYGMEPTVIGEASMFTFIIYEDAGGLPGAEIDTKTGTIVGEEYTGTNFGYDFYKYSVAFDSSIDFAANTTYWIEIQSDAVAWESESVLTLGNDDVFYNTNVGEGVWTPTGGDQFVFNLACEPLAINDMNSFSFTYYPNPVKDYLTIDAKKAIENITVHNLAGQTVLQGAKAVDGKVNMSSLSAGVYVFRVTLEGGQVETFKVIKK